MEYRLFREHCVRTNRCFVKDLGYLGRDLEDIIIVDNSPQSYLNNPENAIPIPSWFEDKSDTALLDILPLLENELLKTKDVRTVLDKNLDFQQLCRKSKKYPYNVNNLKPPTRGEKRRLVKIEKKPLVAV